ncbi:hypothetical protein V2J09_007083 [Rumex salicifolius]
MLCACSGEQFRFEEAPPRSPESLATRDFSGVSRVSSRTTRNFSASGLFSRIATSGGDQLASKLDDDQVDEAESTLKGTLGLNYEEARALLGRMEYQKGNLSGAIQLFQGIDISRLTSEMIKAIQEHIRHRESKSKGADNNSVTNVIMSMPSVSLFLEAILLKSKTLKHLGRTIDAANECKIIVDIVESALPSGMLNRIPQDRKMQEMFHKAIELLPELWKQAGRLDEAISSYRRALVKPWNLDPVKLASVRRDLAIALLYGGVETNNLEEAILLLFILLSKMLKQEIDWDPEIMDHLTYGLSVCEGFEFLANHFEQVLPGMYDRSERWYVLALCYSACNQNEVAINLLKKVTGKSETGKHKPNLHSFLFGAKLCTQDPKHADEGIDFAHRYIQLATDECQHFIAQAHKFLGICYGNQARASLSSLERERCQKESLRSLNNAFLLDKEDPKLLIALGRENAIQRNLNAAFDYMMLHPDMAAESFGRGWKLLALILSAQHRLNDVETILELAFSEAEDIDHLELLRLKAALQTSQQQPRQAIETYGSLLSQIQPWKRCKSMNVQLKLGQDLTHLEVEAWHNLTEIYAHLESWCDAETCINKAKSIEVLDPKSWHAEGMLMQAKLEYQEALVNFSMSLSMEPEHVPSLVSMAKVLMELGSNSLPIARSLFMNALQKDPTNHDAWFNLGLISNREGLISQACDYFQAAHELSSSAPIHPFL